MQILLSPAKRMDFKRGDNEIAPTKALFPKKRDELIAVCNGLSVEEIADMMKLNLAMAHEVQEQFNTFGMRSTPTRAAALAYNGIAYLGLNAQDFTADDFAFAQQHLNILSGLYGVVRPMDGIKPYRLEMQQPLMPEGYRSLYDYWQESVNGHLSKRLRKGSRTVVNAASNEYSKVVQKRLLPRGTRFLSLKFLDQEERGLRQVVVHTKK
ncbi:MAG: YaaA family protein, partial [Bacteroidales bacterium]|nr:YaaA family protein [Bacteroidales bacterium]